MRYNRLGNTGLVVSELCLGAMTFGDRSSGFFPARPPARGAVTGPA